MLFYERISRYVTKVLYLHTAIIMKTKPSPKLETINSMVKNWNITLPLVRYRDQFSISAVPYALCSPSTFKSFRVRMIGQIRVGGACTISPSTRTLRYGPSCRCAAYVLPKRKKPIFNFGSLGSLRNHLRYRDSIICIYIFTWLISYILGIKTYKIPPQKFFFNAFIISCNLLKFTKILQFVFFIC